MSRKQILLIGAVVALLFAGVAGAIVVARHGSSDRGAPATTSTLAEVSTTTTSLSPLAPEDTTTTVADALPPVSVLPVTGAPTTSTVPATTTTVDQSTVPASANAAACPAAPPQPSGTGPVAAAGVSTVALDGLVKAVSASGRQPAWRSGGDQILRMETASGKDPALCASGPDGTAPRALTTPVGADDPVVSPDGTKVVVRAGVGSSRVRLAVGAVESTTRTAVLEGADITAATWLGNDALVACLTPVGGAARLVKVAVTGGAPATVRDGCTGSAAGSPDGRRLALATMTSLDVIEADGRVVSLPRTGVLGPPSWSADSNRLTFAYTDADGVRALDVFDLTKSVSTQVFRGEIDRPAFSPSGDLIAFTGAAAAGGPRVLRTIGPAGGQVTTIATCAGRCLLPRSAWSSDDTHVVLESTAG